MRSRMDIQFQIHTQQGQTIRSRQGKRRLPQGKRVNPQQQMMHHRVANKGDIHDEVFVNLRLTANLGEKGANAFAHGFCHLIRATGVHHGIGNTAHQILTKADLRVHNTVGGNDFARLQIAQMGGDGGGAEVYRHSIKRPVIIPRPDLQDFSRMVRITQINRDGDLPITLAQGGLQLFHNRQGRG